MVYSLTYWRNIYKRLKENSLCLDIETTYFNGPISVIGLYKPKDGEIDYTAYIKNKNLNAENLKSAFLGCKLLITYNGFSHDVPKIKTEFPGVIPDNILVLDLYLFAQNLKINTSLEVLENTLRIDRLEQGKQKGKSIKLWQRYERYGDVKALLDLVEYNKQDTINLYPLAEELVSKV